MIPDELKAIAQWILWKSEVRDGKATKVPCDAHGRPAAVNDPESWHTYQDALAIARETGLAIGFCFTVDDPYFGVDLDNCWPNMSDEAKEIAGRLATYAEVSPSGKGIKFIARGAKGDNLRAKTLKVPGLSALEVYDRDRFFTITGNLWGLHDGIEDRQEELDWLMDKWLPLRGLTVAPQYEPTEPTADDAAVVERMFSFANGEKAKSLWLGDTSMHGDDDSAADLALVAMIAFACGGPHVEQIERIFGSSVRGQREKWQARDDYRKRTITRALDDMSEFYSPPVSAAWDGWDPDLGHDEPAEGATGGSEPPAFPIPDTGLIRNVVNLIGPVTEASDESIALGMLAMMSAVVGWKRFIQFGESPEPCVLYIVIVGESAKAKKTTAMRSVQSLWKAASEGQDWESPGASTGHTSGRALIEAAMGGSVEIFYTKEPKVDAVQGTPEEREQMENLSRWHEQRDKLLNDPPPVVLVWDEFGDILKSEATWREDTRKQLLAIYNGQHSGIRTSGKSGITVPGGKCSVALLGTMTTDELSRSLNAAQGADGLLGRILFSATGATKPALPFPPERDAAYEAAREAVIEDIRHFMQSLMQGGQRSLYANWSEEARKVWASWYTHKYTTTEGLEGQMFARSQAAAVKIAALLQMAENDRHSGGWGADSVEPRHVEQAIAIIEASAATALGAVEKQVAAQCDRYCDALEKFLKDKGETPLSLILRRAMIAKEPGDRSPSENERIDWIKKDSRQRFSFTDRSRGTVIGLA